MGINSSATMKPLSAVGLRSSINHKPKISGKGSTPTISTLFMKTSFVNMKVKLTGCPQIFGMASMLIQTVSSRPRKPAKRPVTGLKTANGSKMKSIMSLTTSLPMQTTTSLPMQTTTSLLMQTTTGQPKLTNTGLLMQTTTSLPIQTGLYSWSTGTDWIATKMSI